MSLRWIAKKAGMMSFFKENGVLVGATALQIAPHVVSGVKTVRKDSYSAVQLASVSVSSGKKKRLGKPLVGHYESKNIPPKRYAQESRLEKSEEYTVGQELDLSYFTEGSFVDISGVSKGKGYQGVIKRYGDKGGNKSHGASNHRHPGSTGNRTTPGRCLPGRHQAGHMGNEKVTVERLRVLKVYPEKGVILVEGGVPGAVGSRVSIRKAVKSVK